MGDYVRAGDLDTWTEQVGEGPDVLLIGGLGDTVESWQFQLDGLADRYRLTAFDNRGAGRTEMPKGPVSAAVMADDAAAVLRALDVPSAHVAGFSMGSAIAQELAIRHPELVRSLVLNSTYARPDALFRSQLDFWRWLPEDAPSERAFFEAFFTWVYTPRAHADGSVAEIIEEALEFFAWAVGRGLSSSGRRLPRARHGRPPLADRRAHAGAGGGNSTIILPPRFGQAVADADPRRPLRDPARRGPPALPGDPR